ncbi:MAG: carboxypeptidase-like regulatory domain-containing protein [Bacteroidales bacterium]|nr:carboxypeptidase-like regulatory domain-containing protein [Bacteroidales bacterium]
MFSRYNIMIRSIVLGFLMVFTAMPVLSRQQQYIAGTVVDSITQAALPFVNIIYNSDGQGVVSDLEGNFRILKTSRIEFLEFRYLGYGRKIIPAEEINDGKDIRAELSRISYEIDEVAIYPSENPANRIIRLASMNRLKNHPEKTGPFSYIAYEKVIFTIVRDSSAVNENGDIADANENLPDSIRFGRNLESKIDVERFLEKQHLFMMESISNRRFLSPDKDKEEIIASRMSGISQPAFTILDRQLQSFSFYDNLITIANRQYVNPISSGSTDRYFFLIEDTLYTTRLDTVFIISFRPRPDRNFEGMEGVLYINSNGYALQNVIATGSGMTNDFFDVSIEQEYDLVDGYRWFPVSLSTTIRLNNTQLPAQPGSVQLIGMGKSTFTNVDFSLPIDEDGFNEVGIVVNPDAHRQPEELWNKYRVDSLNAKELETYRVIDSIGEAQHIDRTILSFETLLTGYLPGRYINLDIMKFIDYNKFEGFRFGLGGKTTQNLSGIFVWDGYLAYSLRDKAFKYGAGITVNILPERELSIRFSYLHDVRESGGIGYQEIWNMTGSAFFRNYMIEVMDITNEAEISLGFRAIRFLTGDLYLKRSRITPSNDYRFVVSELNPGISLTRFDYTEAGLHLRYAYNETYMKTPRGNKFSLGTDYPIIYLNIAKGLKALGGGYSYYRSEIKVTRTFKTKIAGETRVALEAGMVTRGVPYSKLYAAPGSYRKFTVESEASFGAMRLNEFLSDRFLSLFLKHDFGNLLFRPAGKFRPEIVVVHNLGFGTLKYKTIHENIPFKTLEKGYFEAGLLINNLLRIQILRYGLGVFYRYGPYAFHKTIDNFAFKLTLQLNL